MTGHRILVIDDEAALLRLITRAMRAHHVRCASTAAEALALVSSDPELVICDYDLGSTSARELIPQLRAHGLKAPVLLVSGEISADDWSRWAAFLADDFIPKPFTNDLLVHKATRLLEREVLARTVERKHAELASLHAREERESEAANKLLARLVQRGSFPDGVRVANVPAGRFGGDVVLGTLVGGNYRWLVGDVTGHTLASALVTIPLAMIFYGASRANVPFEELIATANEHLAMVLPVGMFCAAIVMELDRATGELRVWSGGAPDVAIRRASGELIRLAATDVALAVIRDERMKPYIARLHVGVGDRIFAFTDGLYDLPDRAHELSEVCARFAHGAPESVFDRVFDDWQRERRPGGDNDDMCLVEVLV